MDVAYVGYTKSGTTFLTHNVLNKIPGVRVLDGRWDPKVHRPEGLRKADEFAKLTAINHSIRYDDERFYKSELVKETLHQFYDPRFTTILPLGGLSPGWFDVTPQRICESQAKGGRILISIRRQTDLLKSRYQHDSHAAAGWLYFRNNLKIQMPPFNEVVTEEMPDCRFPLCGRTVSLDTKPPQGAIVCGGFCWLKGHRPISLPVYEFDRFFEAYASHVGSSRVHVFVLEAWKKDAKKELERLTKFLDVEVTDQLKTELLAAPPANVQKNENVIELSEADRDFVFERYRGSNQRLAELIGIDLGLYGYF